jgi:pyrroline-5-carboxylate reductase
MADSSDWTSTVQAISAVASSANTFVLACLTAMQAWLVRRTLEANKAAAEAAKQVRRRRSGP